MSLTLGASWVLRWFNAGYSRSMQKFASTLPDITTTTVNVSIHVDELSLIYSNAVTESGGSRLEAGMMSLRWTDDLWSVYAAGKTYDDDLGDTQLVASGSVHRHFGSHLALGYIYGRYEGAHSLSAQYYF